MVNTAKTQVLTQATTRHCSFASRTLLVFTFIHIKDLLLAFESKIGWSAGQCSALSHCDSPSAKCMGPLEFCHVDGKHIQAMQYCNYCHLHYATVCISDSNCLCYICVTICNLSMSSHNIQSCYVTCCCWHCGCTPDHEYAQECRQQKSDIAALTCRRLSGHNVL